MFNRMLVQSVLKLYTTRSAMLRYLVLTGILLVVFSGVDNVSAEKGLLNRRDESAEPLIPLERVSIFRRRVEQQNKSPPKKNPKKPKSPPKKKNICACCDQKIGCHLDGSYGMITEPVCQPECPSCYKECMNYYNNGAHPCPGVNCD